MKARTRTAMPCSGHSERLRMALAGNRAERSPRRDRHLSVDVLRKGRFVNADLIAVPVVSESQGRVAHVEAVRLPLRAACAPKQMTSPVSALLRKPEVAREEC